jgi:DNA (cytosine-5)-methyltransferase 1
MNELALFAGAGGGILAGPRLGWRTVCAVEREAYPAGILAARQNDGTLPPFPIWSDVATFNGRPWRGIVDVVSGGFPCQDISPAGRGAGLSGARSGLWWEMARIIGEIRPRFAFVENSSALVSRGLNVVVGSLASMGYVCRWGVVRASDAGAPHVRARTWIAAMDTHADYTEWRPREYTGASAEPGNRPGWSEAPGESGIVCKDVADAAGLRERKPTDETHAFPIGGETWPESFGESWWEAEPPLGRVADGMAYRVDMLRATGNGQVPAAAYMAWNLLTDGWPVVKGG